MAAWTLLGLVFWYEDRHLSDPDRFDPEVNARGSRRAALSFGVASVILFASATMQPEHRIKVLIQAGAVTLLAMLTLGASFLARTPLGQRYLARLREQDARKNGSGTAPAAASVPGGQAATTWENPPYFRS